MHSARCWQHPSVILCCVASTGIALLTHIGHMETILYGTVDSRVYIAVCVFFPLVLKQFRPGRFYPYCNKHLFLSVAPPPFSSSNTTCSLFVCVGKLLRCVPELVIVSVFQNPLA